MDFSATFGWGKGEDVTSAWWQVTLCVPMWDVDILYFTLPPLPYLQSFDAVGWAAGRASGLKKTWVLGCWHGYLSGARCRLAYGPADATATYSCFSKIQIGCTFLLPAYQGSSGQRAVKQVCVYLTLLWIVDAPNVYTHWAQPITCKMDA